eukprot:6829862-Prymnesium_polylepis.1
MLPSHYGIGLRACTSTWPRRFAPARCPPMQLTHTSHAFIAASNAMRMSTPPGVFSAIGHRCVLRNYRRRRPTLNP